MTSKTFDAGEHSQGKRYEIPDVHSNIRLSVLAGSRVLGTRVLFSEDSERSLMRKRRRGRIDIQLSTVLGVLTSQHHSVTRNDYYLYRNAGRLSFGVTYTRLTHRLMDSFVKAICRRR